MGGTINEQFPVGVTRDMALDDQLRRVTAERDQLRAELAAAKEEAVRFERHYISTTKDVEKMRDQLAEVIEERTALAAHVERLVGVLAKQECRCRYSILDLGKMSDWGLRAKCERCSALAATPAQSLAAHDAAVKVAVLREVARHLDNADFEWLMAEADRIAKEAANG